MTTITQPLQTTVDYFESVYAEAAGDPGRVPWSEGHASDALINWLNAVAPSLIRCGGRVAVVGCGLGEDARELIRRGYEVTAFDCSDSAVAWARRQDSRNVDCYQQADLFEPPARWRHRFDLVVEVKNLQWLASDLRPGAMSAIADLMSPHGRLLVICRGAAAPVAAEDGPPWPLTEVELLEATALAGLEPDDAPCGFTDDETGAAWIRALFRRSS